MSIQQLTNPLGGGSMSATVSDYRTGRDAEGNAIAVADRIVLNLRANAAIAVGDLVAFVVPTASVPLSVKQAVNGDQSPMKVGVALAAASAGQVVPVCFFGPCFVKVGSGTPAAGNWASPSSTAGEVTVNSSAPDATTVAGTILGVFTGTKDSNNLAPFFFLKA